MILPSFLVVFQFQTGWNLWYSKGKRRPRGSPWPCAPTRSVSSPLSPTLLRKEASAQVDWAGTAPPPLPGPAPRLGSSRLRIPNGRRLLFAPLARHQPGLGPPPLPQAGLAMAMAMAGDAVRPKARSRTLSAFSQGGFLSNASRSPPLSWARERRKRARNFRRGKSVPLGPLWRRTRRPRGVGIGGAPKRARGQGGVLQPDWPGNPKLESKYGSCAW